jgi:hypothetical protein
MSQQILLTGQQSPQQLFQTSLSQVGAFVRDYMYLKNKYSIQGRGGKVLWGGGGGMKNNFFYEMAK